MDAVAAAGAGRIAAAVAWPVSIACAAVMGFAIQRGGTCAVAAIEQLLTERRADRLLAMIEASVWVAGGLALAQLAHLAGSMPTAYAAGAGSVVGGVLLGLGAWINTGCVIGTVARLGSGEWAYAATPLGFYVGCLSTMPLFGSPQANTLSAPSPLFVVTTEFSVLFVAYAAWRLRPGLAVLRRVGRSDWHADKVWAPHVATIVIGVTFVVTLLLAGRWAYTDLLADLARAMHGHVADLTLPVLLSVALFAGALIGGRTAGRWRSTPVSKTRVARCFVGGLVMAWGSLLIPGSNDGLVLIGFPLLRPYAWLALASMVITIAAAMACQRRRPSRH